MKAWLYIEPLDVLFLRGNKFFGDPGSFGESFVPPWPSVVAGAIRSALLVHKGYDLARFPRGEIREDPELGTPERPGSFTLTAFHLARRYASGKVEPLFALPADLVVGRTDDDALEIHRMRPYGPAAGILSSAATEYLAVLPQRARAKPVAGLWMTAKGWQLHLQGDSIRPSKHLLESRELWSLDTRVGVGLDPARRRAEAGKLFTVQAVALRKMQHFGAYDEGAYDVGFLAAVAGAELPNQLDLRLGGDGRAALAERVEPNISEPDYEAIAQAGRCRLILTTPGLFAGGWRPTGTSGDGRNLRLDLHGVKARLVSASVPRAEIVSGWDIAKWSQGQGGPKPAQRVAPTGSIYWLEELHASPAALRNLAEHGLWLDSSENSSRRAEGFNRCILAAY